MNDPRESTTEGPCECELCGETFDSERALQRHVRTIGIVD